ncbi:hypothetical protein [Mesorhizobium sp.]|uniref:hypothetical protein n=1 Tax=Mesorhizobium sp. TaxID=1871066 RepID=UPI000FE8D6BD|nr:hypothetical protein [Mesorhizobium sp.]RWQ59649.1 MAG: hypothetical protein EOS83_09565 [Mesorhizobium sp.]
MAAPYFYTSTIVRADELTDGLVDNVRVLTSNLSMSPAGRSDGTDRQVAGGGTVYGRTVQEQADVMANAGEFVATYEEAVETTELYSNGTGYTFVRFREGFRNCCLPLGYVANQNGAAFGGAMTLVEGPNLVALRVLTTLLIERNYTESQVSDLCWPVRPSIDAKRERAMIYFKTIPEITDENGQNVYADRDVLHARGAECVVRYTHKPTGEPDGGGEGALIVNGLTEFRFDFRFRPEIFI